MKIAIPVFQGRVSPVLDSAETLLIVQIDNNVIVSKEQKHIKGTSFIQRLEFLKCLGLDMIICGAVSKALNDSISYFGIQITAWISGALNDILDAYLADSLNEDCFKMPGCCRQSTGYGMRKKHGKYKKQRRRRMI